MMAQLHNKPALILTVIEKSRFTLEIELKFHNQNGKYALIDADSSANIRVYLDTQSVEVITSSTNLLSMPAIDYPLAALDAKWPGNYQLDKWLTHCLSQGYQLLETTHSQPMPA
jgi:uncharacterized protein YqiB (DUF1249 family)